MSLIRGHVEVAQLPNCTQPTLAVVPRGSRVRVVRISGAPRLIQRLATLGIVPDVQLVVIKPNTPTIVSLGGARIAIGGSAARAVEIEVI